MRTLWFTSDHHFGQRNIHRFDGRPYADVYQMNDDLISRWNSVVRDGDIVYHLGDLFFQKRIDTALELRRKLQGSIRLIRGNHDRTAEAMKPAFEWIRDYYELQVPDDDADGGRQMVVLSHYPFRDWNKARRGSYHLHGHCHGLLPSEPLALSLDVGCMLHDYKPVSYNRVKEILKAKMTTGLTNVLARQIHTD